MFKRIKANSCMQTWKLRQTNQVMITVETLEDEVEDDILTTDEEVMDGLIVREIFQG